MSADLRKRAVDSLSRDVRKGVVPYEPVTHTSLKGDLRDAGERVGSYAEDVVASGRERLAEALLESIKMTNRVVDDLAAKIDEQRRHTDAALKTLREELMKEYPMSEELVAMIIKSLGRNDGRLISLIVQFERSSITALGHMERTLAREFPKKEGG